MIKVLIVEDSPVVRRLLDHILSSDPEISVIGTASNGGEALEAVARQKPDVITMDINMPGMDGYEATRRIMETHPVPIVMVSASCNPSETAHTFRALEAGAVAIAEKPRGNSEAAAQQLIRTVKLMAEVRVVRRWRRPAAPGPVEPVVIEPRSPNSTVRQQKPRLIAIGASTGGPPVLGSILSRLPGDFPAPLLIVQHIAPGFVQGLVDWLNSLGSLSVQLAAHGATLLPGCAYVAPDGVHTGISKDLKIALHSGEPENGLRPAVGHLFRSVNAALQKEAVGILLTGMGKDGAAELKMMKESGATTIAQDKNSSVIHGMPGEAISLDGATYILPPEQIADLLRFLAGRNP